MRVLISRLLALVLLVGVTATVSAQTSLRFTGNAVPNRDRVMIQIDPHVPVDVGGDFTLEFWMKANASQNTSGGTCSPGSGENWIRGNIMFDRAIWEHDRNGDYGLSIYSNGSNRATLAFGLLQFAGGTRAAQGLCGNINVADGNWHHVAVTRSSTGNGQIRIYVDGALDVEGNGPTGDISYADGVPSQVQPGITLNVDNFLGIGAEKFDASATQFPSYNGWIDDVRISTVVRYPAAFMRPTSPHVLDAQTAALYRFDEVAGTAIIDEKGNQSPGVLRPPASRSTDTPFGGGTPSAGTLQFTSPTYSVNEGVAGGTQAITVTRSGGTSGAASVSFQITDVTATLNADYGVPVSSTLSWNDGDGASKTFNITVINDQSPESNETASLSLSAPSGATLGSPAIAVLTIIDDDTPVPPPPPSGGGSGGGSLGLATLLVLLRELARRHGSFIVDANSRA